jgi:hypothetical protein
MVLLNGTYATCPMYRLVMQTAAKKGYFAVCPKNPQTGSGKPGMTALAYAKKLGVSMRYILSTGHSQGGAGSVATAYLAGQEYPDAEIEIMPVQPAWRMSPLFSRAAPTITGRKLIICGEADTIIACNGVRYGYRSFKEPKEFKVIRAGHMTPMREWAGLLGFFD